MTPRRWALLRVVAATIAERGFQGVGMREIGQAAGLNAGTLYHHFKSKDDALLTICWLGQERTTADLEAVLAQPTTLAARVRDLFDRHIQSLGEAGDFIQVYSNHRQDLPADLSADLAKGWEAYRKRLTGLFQEAEMNGEIPSGLDAGHLGRILIGQIRILNQMHRAGRTQELASFSRLAAEIFVKGLQSLRSAPTADA
jgi:AcrR family transcriptional regulator